MLGLLNISFSASQPVDHAVSKEVIFFISLVCIYMLFAGWEVRIVKNCDRGVASGSIFKTEVTVFRYTDRPNPVNNLFIFFLSLKRLCLLTGKNSRKHYCDGGQR